MIRRIVIKNFKSLTNVEVNLGAFTVLIGRNGAGKSAFLQALSVLSWLVRYKSINETFEREKVSFNDLVSLKAHCRQVYWACDVEVATGGEAPVMMNYNAAIGKRHYVHVDTEFARPSTSENVPSQPGSLVWFGDTHAVNRPTPASVRCSWLRRVSVPGTLGRSRSSSLSARASVSSFRPYVHLTR